MKGSSGILLVAVGLVMLYVVLSDKYQCFTEFISCMTGADMRTPEGYTRGTPQPTDAPKIQTPPINGKPFNIWDFIGFGNLGPTTP